jgi:GT2 family glycosyltransferase
MTSSTSPEAAAPKVTVIIPNWNGMRWLDACLGALARQDTTGFVIIVVDNGSTDGSLAFIAQHYPQVEVIALSRNTGFAHAVNVGSERATTPYVLLLNTDTVVYPDFISRLIARMEAAEPDIAAIHPQMLRLDDPGRIDDAGDALSWYGAATKRGHDEPVSEHAEEQEIFSPSGGASLYRRDALCHLGGFDENFFAYLEDVDLGLRGRLRGHRYLYLPAAKVLHKSHGASLHLSRYVELITRNRLLLFAKNVPTSLLLKHFPQLLYGQIYFLLAYARPLASLRGYWAFLRCLPATLRQRRAVLAGKRVAPDPWERWISNEPPQPPLGALIVARIRRIYAKVRGVGHGGR